MHEVQSALPIYSLRLEIVELWISNATIFLENSSTCR